MGVTSSRFHFVVTEQLPDHCRTFPDQKTAARVGMPEVMKAHVLKVLPACGCAATADAAR